MSEVKTLREKLVLMKVDFNILLAKQVKEEVSYGNTHYSYFSAILIFSLWLIVSTKYKVWLDKHIIDSQAQNVEDGKGKKVLHNQKLKMVLINLEDLDDTLEYDWAGSGENGTEKGFGAAITYGVRYFIQFLFDKTDGLDDPEMLENIKGNKNNGKTTAPKNNKPQNLFSNVNKKERFCFGKFDNGMPDMAYMKTKMTELFPDAQISRATNFTQLEYWNASINILRGDVKKMMNTIDIDEILKSVGLNVNISPISFDEAVCCYVNGLKSFNELAGEDGWEDIEAEK